VIYVIVYASVGVVLGGVIFYRNRNRFSSPAEDIYIALGVALVWPVAVACDAIRAIREKGPSDAEE
jgi:hypothetical protein